jgi:hypothetical protein
MVVRPVLCAVAGLAACTPATSRPPFAPLPQATALEVVADPPAVAREAGSWLTAAGVPVVRNSEIDRYVETGWYAPRPDSSGVGFPHQVKTRLWADPAGVGRTRVTVETVYRPVDDPSRLPRDLEVLVPAAGAVTADRLVTALKERFTVP